MRVIPVGDFVKRSTTPYVNWTLIAINVAVFVYMLTLSTAAGPVLGGLQISEADRFFYRLGLRAGLRRATTSASARDATPRDLALVCPAGGREPLQLFTSMFVHAGWAHIFGNMLFLWIFGDNVEDRWATGATWSSTCSAASRPRRLQTFMVARHASCRRSAPPARSPACWAPTSSSTRRRWCRWSSCRCSSSRSSCRRSC